MREYRADQAIQQVWQARERLMVCVGPNAGGEHLVRAAARLASSLKADWLAVYIETPDRQRLSQARRDRVLSTLRLAEELGAETLTLAADDLATTLLAHARGRNVSKLVVGRSSRSLPSRLLRPTLPDQLAKRAGDLDVYVVSRTLEPAGPPSETGPAASLVVGRQETRAWAGYGWATAVCAAVSLLATQLGGALDPANVIMVYLLGVVWVTVRHGRGPGLVAACLSVLAFDLFLVPPHFSFSVQDTQYLLTFAVMLSVALTISTLTARLRYQARVSLARERRTSVLYELGGELAGALGMPQIVEIGCRHLRGEFQARVGLLLPDAQGRVQPARAAHVEMEAPPPLDPGIAQWVYDHQERAGLGTHTLPASPVLYLPLKAPMRTRGVLALEPQDPRLLALPEQYRLLETCAGQIALALERVHYVEVAQEALVSMESERLRNALLAALSHDLRTPLTALVGLSSALLEGLRQIAPEQARLARDLHEEALGMSGLVGNLLDIARFQGGGVRLNRQWQPLEEVVGSALRATARVLGERKVSLDLPGDLPLMEFDAVLLERVLVNLLENAGKYTPAGSPLRLGAVVQGKTARVWLEDQGPGLPPGDPERLFDKFTRGAPELARPGVGLGLALCRTIVEAHGGRIQAENRHEGGARFSFTLPLTEPPALPESLEPDDSEVPHGGAWPHPRGD